MIQVENLYDVFLSVTQTPRASGPLHSLLDCALASFSIHSPGLAPDFFPPVAVTYGTFQGHAALHATNASCLRPGTPSISGLFRLASCNLAGSRVVPHGTNLLRNASQRDSAALISGDLLGLFTLTVPLSHQLQTSGTPQHHQGCFSHPQHGQWFRKSESAFFVMEPCPTDRSVCAPPMGKTVERHKPKPLRADVHGHQESLNQPFWMKPCQGTTSRSIRTPRAPCQERSDHRAACSALSRGTPCPDPTIIPWFKSPVNPLFFLGI